MKLDRSAALMGRRFMRASDGVSLVEFGLLAPVMMLLFCGAIELGRTITASNRATFVVETIAQLVSQVDHPLTANEISAFVATSVLINPDILTYRRQSQKPLDQAVNITISSVAFTQKVPSCTTNCEYDAAVVFSQRNNSTGPARACGALSPADDSAAPTPSTLPRSVYGPSSLVVVDADIFIKPVFSFLFKEDVKFTRSSYFRPRIVRRVDSDFNCNGFAPVT